eukprot:399768_1
MTDSTHSIVNQLLVFGVGTKEEILNAINKVVNKTDINEIIDYIKNSQNNTNIEDNQNDAEILNFHDCINEECGSIFECKSLENIIIISKYYSKKK